MLSDPRGRLREDELLLSTNSPPTKSVTSLGEANERTKPFAFIVDTSLYMSCSSSAVCLAC